MKEAGQRNTDTDGGPMTAIRFGPLFTKPLQEL